jgi:multiple sugar transport system substrate-binding protein
MVYRESLIRAAGFDSFPKDTAGFLKLCQALKARNTPPGFSFGHALGNANNWCHWLLWSHGGRLVDDENNVVVNSKEVLAALTYARELYSTFIPGTLSWDDMTNDKLFLDAKSASPKTPFRFTMQPRPSDPRMKELATTSSMRTFPSGLPVNQRVNDAHANDAVQTLEVSECRQSHMQFMMEKDQFYSWAAALGYVGQLKAYEAHPLWTSDPKHIVYRDAAKRMLTMAIQAN